MRVRVQVFAQLKSVFHADAVQVYLEEGGTVGELLEQLRQMYPALTPWLESTRVAVNREYTALDTVLHESDEIALIPAVSGG